MSGAIVSSGLVADRNELSGRNGPVSSRWELSLGWWIGAGIAAGVIGGALASQAYGYGYPVYGYSYGYPAAGYSA